MSVPAGSAPRPPGTSRTGFFLLFLAGFGWVTRTSLATGNVWSLPSAVTVTVPLAASALLNFPWMTSARTRTAATIRAQPASAIFRSMASLRGAWFSWYGTPARPSGSGGIRKIRPGGAYNASGGNHLPGARGTGHGRDLPGTGDQGL